MSLSKQLRAELDQLAGFSSDQWKTVQVSGADGIALEVDLTAVDTLSCAIHEIRLQVPALSQDDFDTVKKWAEQLSQQVTYLLEDIRPLEIDEEAGEILIRSTEPETSANGSSFYEVRLQSQSGGNFILRRYEVQSGQPGRQQVAFHFTRQVLSRLVDDLVDTIPE